MYNRLKIAWLIGPVTLGVAELSSCRKLHDLTQNPELGPLEQGFKASAAIGYCASLATTAFTGRSLPANVSFDQSSTPEYSSSGVLHVRVTQSSPLPFNSWVEWSECKSELAVRNCLLVIGNRDKIFGAPGMS